MINYAKQFNGSQGLSGVVTLLSVSDWKVEEIVETNGR